MRKKITDFYNKYSVAFNIISFLISLLVAIGGDK